jgi:hypothetical protein
LTKYHKNTQTMMNVVSKTSIRLKLKKESMKTKFVAKFYIFFKRASFILSKLHKSEQTVIIHSFVF